MTTTIETGAWKVSPYKMGAEELYDLLSKHRLIPASRDAVEAIISFMDRSVFLDLSDEGGHIAFVVLSNPIAGEKIDFDLIPDPARFSRGQYEGALRECLTETICGLFERYRRVNAGVPRSRSRTKHALLSLGFQKEGLARRAARFDGRDPEDVLILGMLKSDFGGGA